MTVSTIATRLMIVHVFVIAAQIPVQVIFFLYASRKDDSSGV